MKTIEKLLNLESQRKYVFHGSPSGNIESLEPRQGTHIPDLTKPTESILDGRPAVSATPFVELAVFRAIINDKTIPINHSSGFGITNGEKHFSVSSVDVLEHAKGKSGYVYVFDKKDFEPYDREDEPKTDNMEWRAYTGVKPVDIIEVTFDDLPFPNRIEVGE